MENGKYQLINLMALKINDTMTPMEARLERNYFSSNLVEYTLSELPI